MSIQPQAPVSPKMVKTDQTFESAADLFRVMSAPMRLKIINCLCDGEKNVSYLLTQVNTTQPNMSQHLNTLYQAGILGKRRDGVQIFTVSWTNESCLSARRYATRSPVNLIPSLLEVFRQQA